ncbi:MAG: TIGR01906 family membrane protein [Caldicoprobacterales bacterium]|jgi:integral membrane protein (TIGR01906 family)|nr:TIGR01906 family membrane protein [Clostridiales bacterium]
MNTKSMANYIFSFIIALLIFPVLLVTAIEMVAYDQSFYRGQYEILDTAAKIGVSNDELSKITRELIDYIRNKNDSIENIYATIKGVHRKVFNEREIAHMVDVKKLFSFAGRVRRASLACALLLFTLLLLRSKKKTFSYFSISYLLTFGFLLAIVIISIPIIGNNFTFYWDQFHYLFFDNDLWILNPETDIMIQMVPEPFFQHAVIRVVSYFITFCLVLCIASIWWLYTSRKSI